MTPGAEDTDSVLLPCRPALAQQSQLSGKKPHVRNFSARSSVAGRTWLRQFYICLGFLSAFCWQDPMRIKLLV